MSSIRKEKNYLFFTNNKGNEYKLDINKGIFYSLKDKPLINPPTEFKTYLRSRQHRNSFVIEFLYNYFCWHNYNLLNLTSKTDILMICDKIDSVAQGKLSPYNQSFRKTDFEVINKHFKKFAKYIEEHEHPTLGDFYYMLQSEELASTLNIKIDGHFYTQAVIHKLSNILHELSCRSYTPTPEETKLMAYWLADGMYVTFENVMSVWSYAQIFKDFFKWSNWIEYTPSKQNFVKQYAMVKQTYTLHKAEYDTKNLALHLAKHKHIWEFETDKLFIKLPQNAEDFKKEADYQKNCVYRSYLETAMQGDTNIIFIRRKNQPEVPYITCEVGNDGSVWQYLTKCNCTPTDTEAKEFYVLFKQFIEKNWNK